VVEALGQRVAVALDAAVGFLLGPAGSRDGSPCTGRWWCDFDLFGVASDEWVTAYTASALAETGQPDALAAAREAWSSLERRSAGRPGGFAYNGNSTRDGDSTVWACRLARALGEESSETSVRALSFLRDCVCPDGGIRTYRTAEELRESISFGAELSPVGWLRSHTCITAVAAVLPEFSRGARDYLRGAQGPNGCWESYWWREWEYATAYAVEAVARSEDVRDEASATRAVEALRSAQGDAPPFALALRVFAASRAGVDSTSILEQLLSLQLADGSWPPSAHLRMPAPWIRDPSQCWYWDYNRQNFGCIRLDSRRIFGTATAVRALSAWLNG
jgi:hypothetical protein